MQQYIPKEAVAIAWVVPDGNAWCCYGENFINLQESNNYAFGDTREEAINEFYKVMNQGTQ